MRRNIFLQLLASVLVLLTFGAVNLLAQSLPQQFIDLSLPKRADYSAVKCDDRYNACPIFSKAISDSRIASSDGAQYFFTWSCGLLGFKNNIQNLSSISSDCAYSTSQISVFAVSAANANVYATESELTALRFINASHAIRMPYSCQDDGAMSGYFNFGFQVLIDVDPEVYSIPTFAGATRIVVLLDGSSCSSWQAPSQPSAMLLFSIGSISNIIWTNFQPRPYVDVDHMQSHYLFAIQSSDPQTRVLLSNVAVVNSMFGFATFKGYMQNDNYGQLILRNAMFNNHSAQTMDLFGLANALLDNVSIENPSGQSFPAFLTGQCRSNGIPCQNEPALRVRYSTNVTIHALTFKGCYTSQCIFMEEFGNVLVTDSSFESFYPVDSDRGALMLLSSQNSGPKLTIQRSVFSNSVTQTAPITLYGYVALDVKSSTFKNLTGLSFDPFGLFQKGGGAISTQDAAALWVGSSTFEQTQTPGYGGAIISSSIYPIVIKNCTFRNTSSGQDGGAIYSNSGVVQMYDSTFQQSRADRGGCVALNHVKFVQALNLNGGDSNDQTLFDHNSFDGCVAKTGGGVLYLSESQMVNVNNCSFTNSIAKDGGVAYADRTALMFADIAISNIQTSGKGGVTLVTGFGGFSLDGASVSNVVTGTGGIVHFESQGFFHLQDVTIQNVKASKHGGILYLSYAQALGHWILMSTLNLDNNVYDLYFANRELRVIGFTNVDISDVSAGISGDFSYCAEPTCLDFSRLLYQGNFSINLADSTSLDSTSDPRSIEIVNFMVQDPGTTNLPHIPIVPNAAGKYEVYPGQVFSLQLLIKDIYQHQITSEPSFIARIQLLQSNATDAEMVKNLLIPESTAMLGQDGFVTFSSLRLESASLSTAVLSLNISFVTPITQQTIDLVISINVVQCPIGFIEQSQPIQCVACENSYSRTRGAMTCLPCPSHASCSRNNITAIDGYYAIYEDEYAPLVSLDVMTNAVTNVSSVMDVVAPCPSPSSCQSGNKCLGNRQGDLCGVCQPGFSEWNGACVPCKSADGGFIVLYIFYLAVIFVVTHLTAQSPASASMKILSFFTQSFLLAIGSYVSLFNWAKALFAFEISLPGGGGDAEAGLRCPFPRDSYGKLITQLVQPVAFLLCLIVLCIITLMIKLVISLLSRVAHRQQQPAPNDSVADMSAEVANDKADSLIKVSAVKILRLLGRRVYSILFDFDSWVRSFVQLLLVSYQMFSNAALGYFACKKFGNRPPVVFQAPDIICQGSEYYARGVPFILVLIYSFSLPLLVLALLLLLRFTNRLQHPTVKTWLGNLFMSYTASCQPFFEAYAMLRRLAIATIVAFVTNSLVLMLVLLPIFSFFLLIQLLLRPYANRSENIAEEVCLLGLIIMIALRSMTDFEVSVGAQGVLLAIFLLVIAVIIMSYIVNYWLVRLVAAKIKRALAPKLAQIGWFRNKDANAATEKELLEAETPAALATSPSASSFKSPGSPDTELKELAPGKD